jgi:TolB protein
MPAARRGCAGMWTALLLAAEALVPADKLFRLTPQVSEESSWSPDSRRLVFDSNRGGGRTKLYVMNADGSGVAQLTSGPGADETPTWSPDGRRIAFVSDRGGNPEIWIVDADGKNRRQLTRHGVDAIHPHWADSRRIIYCAGQEKPERYEIHVVDADKGTVTQLTNEGGVNTFPVYSPDGQQIAFRRVIAGNSEVFIMDADGKQPRNLTNHPAFDGWPAWSPDGARIVFGSNRSGEYRIWVMNADGTQPRQLVDVPGRCTSPKWSPDGQWISFDRALERSCEILRVPAAGLMPGR